MAVNQVIFGNQIVIDITDSTVNPNTLLAGYKAYGANGEQVTGNVELSYHITLHKSQYDQLTEQEKLNEKNFFYIDDLDPETLQFIDDSQIVNNKTWSSSKINAEISNKNKVTTLEVNTLNWAEDTTSQSGTTLYKKTITLNHAYVTNPSVDIGMASGSSLPSTAEQEAYDLLQYVTIDGLALELYASEIPTTTFYINVEGVD